MIFKIRNLRLCYIRIHNEGYKSETSKYDVQKINHMYSCSEPLRNSFSCDFTELNWGGFVNEPIDDKEIIKISLCFIN